MYLSGIILQTHATVDWNDTKNFQKKNPYKIKTDGRIQIKLQNKIKLEAVYNSAVWSWQALKKDISDKIDKECCETKAEVSGDLMFQNIYSY